MEDSFLHPYTPASRFCVPPEKTWGWAVCLELLLQSAFIVLDF